ncbi:MAG TPA: BTAD domain-containing putative transcriptional regulator [Streptosporangiaceae bacterium]
MSVRIAVLGPLEVRDEAGGMIAVGGARLRALLIRLAISCGRPVPADLLAEDLWPGGAPADTANALQALVSRLRAATGRDAIEYSPAGYRLAVPASHVDALVFETLVGAGRAALAGGDQSGGAVQLRQALALWRGPALADVADAPFAAAPVTRLSELRLAATEDRAAAELALGRGAELVPELEELAAAHPLRERLRGQLMRALQAAGRQADALAAYESTRQVLADELGIDPSPALAAVQLAILRGEPAGPADPGPETSGPAGSGATPLAPAAAAVRGRAAPGETEAGDSGPAEHLRSADRAGPARRAGSADQPGLLATESSGGPAAAGHSRAPARRTNLPAQLTSFVGREDELRRLSKLLGEARLVTLTGPGGAGKTRLSVEASARLADELASELPDGVWFVPLAGVRDALDVPQAVLAAVGAVDGTWLSDPVEAARLAALPPLDRLAETLAARRLILVLDNCEHVLDAVAQLAGRVLAGAPGARILATSREPLGITGEMLCPVPSLTLPPETADVSAAAGSSAVRLFIDRAAAVRPGFGLDSASTGPVVRICRALDGIPLAIELAAARLRALTPAQVADRLDDRFRLLSVGSRDALPRHQTLRAIVDWSWELLDDQERAVLRRLSVFGGGATPDSAEAVCALGGDQRDIVDVIASLVDKSLVTATGEHEVRYRLLETVRAYAAERLAEADEADLAGQAHGRYFLDLAERAEPELRARDQLLWLNRLTAEHDNFSAALGYAIAQQDVRTALRFVAALTWFWITRDYESEAGEWATAVRELAGDTPPEGLHDSYAICELVYQLAKLQPDFPDQPRLGEIMDRIGSLTSGSSHPMLALVGPMAAVLTGQAEDARRALAELGQRTDPWLRAAHLLFTGHLAIHDGLIDEAEAGLNAGYAAFEEIGDRWGMIVSLGGQAEVALARNRPGDAVELLERSRQFAAGGLAGNFGEMVSIPLGRARVLAGDTEGGLADLKHGVAFAERLGEHDDEAQGYLEMSEVARRDGDLVLARSQLERALEIIDPLWLRPDMRGVAAAAYSKAGCLAEQDGDLTAAAQWHAKALQVLTDSQVSLLPTNPALATVVEGFAALAAARGEHVRAAELLGLATALQGFASPASLELARAEAASRAALPEGEFDAAYARGARLSRADALALTP